MAPIRSNRQTSCYHWKDNTMMKWELGGAPCLCMPARSSHFKVYICPSCYEVNDCEQQWNNVSQTNQLVAGWRCCRNRAERSQSLIFNYADAVYKRRVSWLYFGKQGGAPICVVVGRGSSSGTSKRIHKALCVITSRRLSHWGAGGSLNCIPIMDNDSQSQKS